MPELWDIVDEYGNKTGRLHERGTTMKKGEYHLSVSVWILNIQGEFLISKRTPTQTAPNMWETTGGSAIAGENSLEAALRETKEELAISLNPEKGHIFKKYTYPHSSGDGAAYFEVWIFAQEVDISTVELQPNETCDVTWASKEKIKQLIEDGQFINYSYMNELFCAASVCMDMKSSNRTNIIGAGEVGCAISVDMDKGSVYKTNSSYWNLKGNDFLEAIVLPFYGAFVSEEKCKLFGDVSGKKLLEVGCGNGQSLQYHGDRKASELWGIDISEKQIEKAKHHLTACGLSARLICSPMEEECGIPENYFDFVYSIYAIGWTTDLEGTFCRIASYLKKGGVFIFSWSHPIHKCVAAENNGLTFKKCYFDESWYSVSLDEGELTLSDRKMSTYMNALAKAGFVIEQMVEQSDDEIIQTCDNNNDFVKKAKMLPLTFVIKARKL